MRHSLTAGIAAGTLALVLTMSSTASARGPGGAGGPGFAGSGGPGGLSGFPPGFSSGGNRVGWGTANHPPGWSRGEKRGWIRGTCTAARIRAGTCVPPGLR